MNKSIDIFISSKMNELAPERGALIQLIPSLSTNLLEIKSWVYEADAQASTKPIRDVFLTALQHSALYIGLFWKEYGEWTIDEYEHATRWGIDRHIYIKNLHSSEKRGEKLEAFLHSISSVNEGIAPVWFDDVADLTVAVERSIKLWIAERLVERPGSSRAIYVKSVYDLLERPQILVGRQELLASASSSLARGVPILLHGFGGAGKTALASAIVANQIEQGKGPVLWQRVGNDAAQNTFEAIARPFRLDQEIAALSEDEQLQAIRNLLGTSGIKLLVLDDVWNKETLNHLMKAIPDGMSLLATSRQKYPEFQCFPIGRLNRPDSLDLLSYFARKEWQKDSNASSLCEKLGDNAFALRIAGMNLNNDNLSPAELLERLDTAPHRLEVPMGIAAMGQTSIATLLEVSLNALYSADEHSRRAYATFLAMGAFFSPQHTAQLLSLYDVKVPDVDDGLITTSRSHLADLADSIENLPGILRRNVLKNIKSKAIERSLTLLVERGLVDHYVTTEESQAYYRLHDLAYSYARVQNTERERFQALRACLYYVSLYNEPDVADFNALQPVIDNLIGSANWAEKMNYVPSVYGFALNLFSQGNQFLDYRGYFVQAKQLQEKALKIAEQRDDPMAIAVFKLNLSRLCNTLGQIQESTALASNALGLAQDLHDKRLQRQALTYLGVASGIRSDPEQAVSYFEEAIAIDRELEDKTGEIVCLNNLGTVYRKTGQDAKATACFEEALRLNQQLGDKKLEGRTEAGIHNNLGTICWQSKQFKEAIEHYEQARQILLALGDRPGLCGTLANLGNALDDSGQTEAALETLQHASSLARELGIKVGEADILNSIGAVQYKRKQYRTALDSYLEARAIYVELRIEEKRKIVDYNIEGTRQTLLANEDFDNRILWSQKAVELRKLGDNYRLQNDPQQSLDYYEQALQIHRQLGDVRGEGITLINLGSAHGMMQNYDLALRVFKDAKYLFELFGEQDLAKHAAHCIKLTEKYLPGGKVPSRTLLPKRFVHLLHIFRPRRHE